MRVVQRDLAVPCIYHGKALVIPPILDPIGTLLRAALNVIRVHGEVAVVVRAVQGNDGAWPQRKSLDSPGVLCREVSQGSDRRLLGFHRDPGDRCKDNSKLDSDVGQRDSPTWALVRPETHLEAQLKAVAIEKALDVEVRQSRLLQVEELDDVLLALRLSLLHCTQVPCCIRPAHLPGRVRLHGIIVVDGCQVEVLRLGLPIPGLCLELLALSVFNLASIALQKRHRCECRPGLAFGDAKRGSPGLVASAEVLLHEARVRAETLCKPQRSAEQQMTAGFQLRTQDGQVQTTRHLVRPTHGGDQVEEGRHKLDGNAGDEGDHGLDVYLERD